MPAAKDWSPEGIHSWVNEFIESTGRAPTLRDMDKDGPNRRNRTKYGGIIGILAVAGISATTYGVHRYRSKQGLIQEVRMWSEQHLPPDRQLKQLDLHVARLNGHLSFHPDTIGNHFDSWKQFLTEAGFARQEWAPAECVQFGRTLIETYSHSKLEKLIDRYGVTGRTPDFDTFKAYYPDIKKFMFERVKWENWQPKKERGALLPCWVGYATLALARASGDTSYIAKEMDSMAKIKLGPGYDLNSIGRIDDSKQPKAVGIRLQDNAVQAYEALKKTDTVDPKTVSKVFVPEILDALNT